MLLLQDKQRINHLIKAVHAKLCGVQTLYLSTPRSLTVLGMRTISWTALSFQPALLAVHFGADG
ncbi:hypothetical protein ACQ9AN_25880, partial [Escherichia coli]